MGTVINGCITAFVRASDDKIIEGIEQKGQRRKVKDGVCERFLTLV